MTGGGDRGDRGLVFAYLTLTLTPELIPLAESHYALKVTHNNSPVTGGGGDGAILFRLRLVSALMSLCQISAGPCSAAGTPSIFSLNLGPSLGIIWGLSGDCGVLADTTRSSLFLVFVC